MYDFSLQNDYFLLSTGCNVTHLHLRTIDRKTFPPLRQTQGVARNNCVTKNKKSDEEMHKQMRINSQHAWFTSATGGTLFK